MIEKVLFLNKIFNLEILINLHVCGLLNPKITFLAVVYVYVLVIVCICYALLKTNHIKNSKFGIVHMHHMYTLLESFYEDPTNSLYTGTHTLKKRLLLNIENNSSWVNCIHFQEKTHLLALELIFVNSCGRVYMHVKFDIWDERLQWNKKRSIFSK